jgi:hypothetical protein
MSGQRLGGGTATEAPHYDHDRPPHAFGMVPPAQRFEHVFSATVIAIRALTMSPGGHPYTGILA